MSIARKGLGEILLEKQFMTAEQLEEAKQAATATGGDLAKAILSLGFATEPDVYKAKAEAEGFGFVDLTKHKPDTSAINVVPQAIAQKHNILPVKKDGTNLWIATLDPSNIVAMDDVRAVSRCMVRAVLAAPTDLNKAIKETYGSTGASGGGMMAPPPSAGPAGTLASGSSARPNPMAAGAAAAPPKNEGGGGVQIFGLTIGGKKDTGPVVGNTGNDLASVMRDIAVLGNADVADDAAGEAEAETAPVVRMANAIMVQAIEKGASDIHIEPFARNVRVRFRIDGVLNEETIVPNHIKSALIARYKIMSDMNIAEKRIPQDGRIGIRHGTKEYDMRVSCLPSMFGEKIVMRILDKSSVMIGLNKLGLLPGVERGIREATSQPNGMFLMTGPTGSGKTTTLYSVLNNLNDIEKNITTCEDPIEYQLTGVTQVQINKKAGMDFGKIIRCFLRQDPDIIMVGEMRDLETADIAIEASLTGHLVLSTLHTNDAPSAILRLTDMGVENFLVAATVVCVVAQRLGRRVCPQCDEEYQMSAAELYHSVGVDINNIKIEPLQVSGPEEMITLHRGRGCENCRNSGMRGRTGFHELMAVNGEVADLIVRKAPVTDLREAARANGMYLLREDGLTKIRMGITTADEVRRVIFTAGQ
jgi:type IV pilus assembly protein PilB